MKSVLHLLDQSRCSVLGGILLVLVATGCSSQEATIRSADRHFAAGEYDKAEIEYKNVVQASEAKNAHAIARLGVIYFEQGRLRHSAPFLFKARQLQADDLELRAMLAMFYLAARNLPEARAEADWVLTQQPTHAEAPLLLVEASRGSPADWEAARQRLKQLPAPAQEGAPVLTALGILDLFQRNLSGADAFFKRSLEIDPKLVATHSAQAMLFLAQNDRVKTEQALKTAADLAPIRSGKALQYAQFKIQGGDKEGGRRLLEDLAAKAPDYLPPQLVLAELAATEKRYDDSTALVEKVLARDPTLPEAMLLRGRLSLGRGEPEKAVAELDLLLKSYPGTPQGLYFAGMAYAATGDKDRAIDHFNRAIKISPMPEAILALAAVHLRTGDYGAVVQALTPYVQKQPTNLQARLMLAEAHRAAGNLQEALSVQRATSQDFKDNPQASFQTGVTHLMQGDKPGARSAFSEALKRAPGFLAALEQLVNLDLVDRQYPAALERLGAELVRDPNSAAAYLLMGKVHAAQGDAAKAEEALKKSIDLRPDVAGSYIQLAQLYINTGQQEKAVTSLKEAAERDPKNIKALLTLALIHEQQKNYDEARTAYEKVLAVDPASAITLNNLAFLYSEQPAQLDRAYELAQKARDLLPGEPRTADTLGWILYQRGQYPRALTLLEESAAGVPDNAEVQYHLGMTRYKLGLEEPARVALEHALVLDPNHPAKSDIRQRLALLTVDPSRSPAQHIESLETHLAASPGDPIALVRLAAHYERSGAKAKAVSTYQAAAKANPTSPTPWSALAKLYAAEKDIPKAMEAAKTARKLAPDDATIARTLGLMAHELGDSVWGASLLQEAVRKQPDNRELLFDAALVVYSIGNVAEAKDLVSQSIATPPATTAAFNSTLSADFSRSDEARQFLEMTALSDKPEASAAPKIEQTLQKDPTNVPALMAHGALAEQKSDATLARQAYEKALDRFPAFTPAKLRLALLSLVQREVDPKAFEWAQQARTAYPNDPEAAKALGALIYRRGGDPTRAISLLRQSTASRETDAEAFYFLGLAQLQGKDVTGAEQSILKATTLGLRAEYTKDAKEKLDAAKSAK